MSPSPLKRLHVFSLESFPIFPGGGDHFIPPWLLTVLLDGRRLLFSAELQGLHSWDMGFQHWI